MKNTLPPTLLDIFCEKKGQEIKTQLLEEWTDSELTKVKRKIAVHFMKSWDYCSNWLGLPYTSSSSFAGLWVTNATVNSEKYPLHHYVGFAMGENGNVYAVLWDANENEILDKI